MRMTLSILLLCGTLLIGCKTVVVHPVDGTQIRMETQAGQNWVCFTPQYMKDVMKIKLEAK